MTNKGTASPSPTPPHASESIGPQVLPRPDFRFRGEVGRTIAESDPASFPQPVRPPKGAPNIVLVMLDDVGFGQFSTFGGMVPSPTADRLAAEGLRFNQFHTTAICSPTRAALITGRNHHSVGFGCLAELATGYDGYTSIIPHSTATVGEILRQNGYATAWIGKAHNTPSWVQSAVGPFDQWPTGLGFDYFYGFLGGETSQFEPALFEGTTPVPRSNDPNYHLSTDLVDRSIDWIRTVKAVVPDRPYFLYLVPGATHAPHQPPANWLDKFKGQFDMGWDAYREQTLERQKALGVVPKNTKLTERSDGIPAWDTLEPDQQRLYARMMEVYAAYGAHADYEIGRVIDAVKQLPDADNTLIVYLLGDNGASAEGGLEGTLNEMQTYAHPVPWQDVLKHIDEIGTRKHHNHYPVGWAHAMNTPMQWTKQVASHFGGTRNPLVMSWPARIKQGGGLRPQFHHTIDIAPTLLEAAGIPEPTMVNGMAQKPIEGVSLNYLFDDAGAASHRRTQYFEMEGYRGLYHDGWMASSFTFIPWSFDRPSFDFDSATWELYDITKDFSQAEDLAQANPLKVKQMDALFWAEAAKYNVLPLDVRALERTFDEVAGRPNPAIGRTHFEYPGRVTNLNLGAAPLLPSRSFSVTAEVTLPAEGCDGMIFTQGGYQGGWAFYVQNRHLVGVHSFFALEHYRLVADSPLPVGDAILVLDFAYEGGGNGKGGTMRLSVDGATVAEMPVPRTMAGVWYSAFEGQDIGMDSGTPVDDSYTPPFAFQGVIRKVTVDLR